MSKKSKQGRADGPAVVIYPRHEYAAPRQAALAEGLVRHGIKARYGDADKPEPADVAVIWGFRNPEVWKAQKSSGGLVLVMEHGIFASKDRYTVLGWDGLAGNADYCTGAGMPGDRWKKMGLTLDAWRPGGEYHLIMGQVEGDAMVTGFNLAKWYQETADALREIAPRVPVAFRAHPLAARTPAPEGARKVEGRLLDNMRRARCVVTLNSTSGLDAALAGCPVIAVDRGSMAWDVAGHDLADVAGPPTPDRAEWVYGLAYCQWTSEEMAAGDAWAHLRRKWES